MRKALTFLFLILAVSGCQHLAAQDPVVTDQNGAAASAHEGATKTDEHYYKLVFRVIEAGGDGAYSSSRVYTQIVDATGKSDRPSEIRTGDKVPVATGSSSDSGDPKSVVNTQFQYINVGTEIDTFNAGESSGTLHAFITAKISSVGKPSTVTGMANQPLIRECTWNSRVVVPIGKPTIIFASDNPSDKGKTELELTATPIH